VQGGGVLIKPVASAAAVLLAAQECHPAASPTRQARVCGSSALARLSCRSSPAAADRDSECRCVSSQRAALSIPAKRVQRRRRRAGRRNDRKLKSDCRHDPQCRVDQGTIGVCAVRPRRFDRVNGRAPHDDLRIFRQSARQCQPVSNIARSRTLKTSPSDIAR
jgi:hypothetical protein